MPVPIRPTPKLSKSDIERFWKYVDKRGPDECWPWIGSFTNKNYGRLTLVWIDETGTKKRQNFLATRISYSIHKGNPGVLYVLHTCDNPPCCNPRHLFKGTAKQNQEDSAKKGRRPFGEKVKIAKLTEEKARAILQRYYDGDHSLQQIAADYQISKSSVQLIVQRVNWKYLHFDHPNLPSSLRLPRE